MSTPYIFHIEAPDETEEFCELVCKEIERRNPWAVKSFKDNTGNPRYIRQQIEVLAQEILKLPPFKKRLLALRYKEGPIEKIELQDLWVEAEAEQNTKSVYYLQQAINKEMDPQHAVNAILAGMPIELEDWNWHEAFGYAGEIEACGCQPPSQAVPMGAQIPLNPFSREDVKKVHAYAEGENDGPSWVCIGELWDGRFFHLEAGCDYTGWD